MKHGFFFFFCNYIIESLEWNPSSVKNPYFETFLCKCLFPVDSIELLFLSWKVAMVLAGSQPEYSWSTQELTADFAFALLLSTNIPLKQFSPGENESAILRFKCLLSGTWSKLALLWRQIRIFQVIFLLIFHKRVQSHGVSTEARGSLIFCIPHLLNVLFFSCAWLNLIFFVCYGPKHTQSTAKVDSKLSSSDWPRSEIKIKDFEAGASLMATAY